MIKKTRSIYGSFGVAGDDSFAELRLASADEHIELNTTKLLVTDWVAPDSVYLNKFQLS
jgi:hypothetical protein